VDESGGHPGKKIEQPIASAKDELERFVG